MARALRAWAINRGGKNSVRNLQYGPRTRLVRGIDKSPEPFKRFKRRGVDSPRVFSNIAKAFTAMLRR